MNQLRATSIMNEVAQLDYSSTLAIHLADSDEKPS